MLLMRIPSVPKMMLGLKLAISNLLAPHLELFSTFKCFSIIILKRLSDYGSDDNMTIQEQNELKKRIIDEMTADYASALEKNFDLAKQFIRITKDGRVDILFKDKLSGEEQILLYMIGKLYAREAGLIATDEVDNKELLDELGVPKGSLLPWLKSLRDGNKIKQTKRGQYVHHSIPVNLVERTLQAIERKLKKSV